MRRKKRTNQEIADELTAIAVAQLDTLSPKEREARIQAFEKKVATVGVSAAPRNSFKIRALFRPSKSTDSSS